MGKPAIISAEEAAKLQDAGPTVISAEEAAKLPDAPEKPSALDAAGRGIASIAPFQAPLVGGLGAIIGGLAPEAAAKWLGVQRLPGEGFVDAYRRLRDATTAGNEAAAEAHPVAFHAPNILGTGLLAAGTGGASTATLPARLTQAAKFGAVEAAGRSKADLTKAAEDPKQLLGEVADIGAGAGAGVVGGMAGEAAGTALKAGLNKLISSAPARVIKRTLGDIGEGETTALASTRKKIGAKAGPDAENAVATLTEPENAAIMQDLTRYAAKAPRAAVPSIDRGLARRGAQADAIYDAADKATGGIHPVDVYTKITALAEKFAAAGKEMASDEMERVAAAFEKLTQKNEKMGAKTLPSRTVRNFANDVGQGAFAKDPLVKNDIKSAALREAYHEITNLLTEAAEKGAEGAGDRLKVINRDLSQFVEWKRALLQRDEKALAGMTSLTTRLKQIIGAAGVTGVISGAAQGDVDRIVKSVALPTALYVGGKAAAAAVRKADAALARSALSGTAPGVGALTKVGGAIGGGGIRVRPLTDAEVADWNAKRKAALGQSP